MTFGAEKLAKAGSRGPNMTRPMLTGLAKSRGARQDGKDGTARQTATGGPQKNIDEKTSACYSYKFIGRSKSRRLAEAGT